MNIIYQRIIKCILAFSLNGGFMVSVAMNAPDEGEDREIYQVRKREREISLEVREQEKKKEPALKRHRGQEHGGECAKFLGKIRVTPQADIIRYLFKEESKLLEPELLQVIASHLSGIDFRTLVCVDKYLLILVEAEFKGRTQGKAPLSLSSETPWLTTWCFRMTLTKALRDFGYFTDLIDINNHSESFEIKTSALTMIQSIQPFAEYCHRKKLPHIYLLSAIRSFATNIDDNGGMYVLEDDNPTDRTDPSLPPYLYSQTFTLTELQELRSLVAHEFFWGSDPLLLELGLALHMADSFYYFGEDVEDHPLVCLRLFKNEPEMINSFIAKLARMGQAHMVFWLARYLPIPLSHHSNVVQELYDKALIYAQGDVPLERGLKDMAVALLKLYGHREKTEE